MGAIQTAIELQDNFTGVLYQVIASVNLGLAAMEDLHQTMSAPVEQASIEAARDSINQATIAVRELDTAMQGIRSPQLNPSLNAAPVNIPVQPEVQWQSYEGLEVFQGEGFRRYEQEIADINVRMQQLSDTQSRITVQANDSQILSPQASYDIQAIENHVQSLIGQIQQAENDPLNIGTDQANAQLERLRGQLNETIRLQGNLGQAMQGMDIGEINAAYLQLSQSVSDTERMVRDSFSHLPPVEVPVNWRTNTVEVFTNTGIDRFRQEIESANGMMGQLSNRQNMIARQAQTANLLPPQAVQDLNGIAGRMDAIRGRIQQIENNPLNLGTETANAGLEQMRRQLDQAILEQQELTRAMEDMDVSAANEAYLRLSQTVGSTERYIRDNVDEQGRFNREIERGTGGANELVQTIKGAVAAYATMHTISAALNLSDQLVSTTARLDMMNDGLQSTEELQNMIFLSAERSRGAYQATADAVSKLGLMAGDAFSGSGEIIDFMEQINKQFTIAGTEAAGIDAAMLQLTQAMGSGVLRGEEYNSILEQAPNIIQAIADYMEVPKGQLKDMASEGLITAEVVKQAVFAAADQTNAKFESMPKTFSQIWTSFENYALLAFQPVLEQMNEIANSEAFQEFVSQAIEGLALVAEAALEVFNLMVNASSVVADNWSWISPIIYGVVGALTAYYTAMLLYNAVTKISTAITVAQAFASQVHAAALAMQTGATFMATVAQYGFNAALFACPITWIVLAIVALVAVFYAAVAAINKFAGTSISATGVICGVFMVAAAFIGNLFVTLINFAIDIFVVLWNFIASFANFFANVFNDPVGAIARLFFDLADTVLGILEALASAIDTIFGSNLAGAVSGWRGSLGSWVDETFGKGEEVMEKMNAQDYHLERFSYSGAWNAGYEFGQGLELDGAIQGGAGVAAAAAVPTSTGMPSAYTGGVEEMGNDVGDIADNTGSMADSMDVTEEELKYLRDIAEQETVNRFTTAEITIEQTNNNQISQAMDLDGVVSGLTDAVSEAVYVMAKGVHG